METLDEKKIEADIEKANAELKVLTAKAQKQKAELKSGAIDAVQKAKSRVHSLESQLARLKDVGSEAGEQMKKDARMVYRDMKHALSEAREAMKT